MGIIINLKSSHEREKVINICLDAEDRDYDLVCPGPSSDVLIKLSIRAKETGRSPQSYIVITSLPALGPERREASNQIYHSL